jgi:hypothetical protein
MSPMFIYKTPSQGVAEMKSPEVRSPNSSPEFSSWKRKVKRLQVDVISVGVQLST